VTVGGSTTDQRYVGDGDTWQDVLRARSGLAVANAGIDGMSSYGHIVAITEWLHRLPDFSPRFYLHYIGVNDAALSAGPTLSDRAGNEAGLLRILRARSFIVTAIENLWFRAQGPRVVVEPSNAARPRLRRDGESDMVKATW
jgi:hypothetical protein